MMADSFRCDRKNGSNSQEQEFREGTEFRDEENPRIITSSWRKSSPILLSEDNANLVRTSAPKVNAECDDDNDHRSEIITLPKKEVSPQKIAFLPPCEMEESAKNTLDQVEREARREPIIVSPSCCTTLSNSGITEIGADDCKKIDQSDENSCEPISLLSRIDSAKQDMKNLKSATLGRMGKMFKLRPPTCSGNDKISDKSDGGIDADEQYGQDPTRKEKTHSLGRMLRFVDKDGAPRKLFSHTRTGSLTRLRKMHSSVGGATGNSEESRNIFTRMLNQFRGRNSGSTDAERNLQSINEPTNSQKPSLGTRLMMSLSARGTPAAGPTAEAETSVESVNVEYTV